MDPGLNETRMKIAGELAELGLVLARDLQQAALQAEAADDKVRLASAFHRVGRGVRQSLALHARLERDLERAAQQDQAQAISLDQARRARRKAEVKGAVEALIWTEHERLDDPEDLVERLEAILAAEADTEAFLDEAPDAAIARLREVLNIPSPLAGEGVVRRTTDEGSHALATSAHPREGGDPSRAAAADPASPAQPLIRPASAGHLLPQGEKDCGQPPFRPSG